MDERAESTLWQGLYRLGGIAALVAVILFRRNFGAELALLPLLGLAEGWPAAPPTDPSGWFALLHDHPFYALSLFGVVDLINVLLIGLLFLAAGAALRRAAPGLALAAGVLYWIGAAVALASNQAFSMLVLSGQYMAAGTEAERAALDAAGRALLAMHNPGAVVPGAGELLALFLILVAGLVLALAMRRSGVLSRATANVALAANAIALTYFPVLALAPALRALPPVLWAPLRIAWYVMVAVQLLRMARSGRRG